MTDIANRNSGSPSRGSLLGDMLGFDPFRAMLSGYSGQPSYGFEIQRTQNGYDVELPVPGFRPEQINITLDNGVITISGETERRKFTRSISLPDEIDPDNVEAKVEHGMLTLSLRLHPKAQPRKIQVTAGANAGGQQTNVTPTATGTSNPSSN